MADTKKFSIKFSECDHCYDAQIKKHQKKEEVKFMQSEATCEVTNINRNTNIHLQYLMLPAI